VRREHVGRDEQRATAERQRDEPAADIAAPRRAGLLVLGNLLVGQLEQANRAGAAQQRAAPRRREAEGEQRGGEQRSRETLDEESRRAGRRGVRDDDGRRERVRRAQPQALRRA
jgi:hypothetical protein